MPFAKGHTPWHKGKTNVYSQETLDKMSKAKKGIVKSEHIRNYPHCPDCGVKLGHYKSKKCRKCCLVGKPRPDMIGHTWNKGRIGWMKGKKMSDETKKKVSESKKGKRLTMEQRLKKSASCKRGVEHHNWKGGTGTERHRAMEQIEYSIWRDSVFKQDNYTCQMCEQYSGHLHADHIESWANNPELRYDTKNGRTLCRACHYYITFKKIMPSNSKWGLTNVAKKEG
jgi:5-methylcytosine-specific restriction endonuclease McrA